MKISTHLCLLYCMIVYCIFQTNSSSCSPNPVTPRPMGTRWSPKRCRPSACATGSRSASGSWWECYKVLEDLETCRQLVWHSSTRCYAVPPRRNESCIYKPNWSKLDLILLLWKRSVIMLYTSFSCHSQWLGCCDPPPCISVPGGAGTIAGCTMDGLNVVCPPYRGPPYQASPAPAIFP